MYAYLPSGEDSCGSGPAGTRPTIFSDAGSTIASVLSSFSRTSKAGLGVCAPTELATNIKKLKRPRREIQICLELIITTPVLATQAWPNVARRWEGAI